MRNSNNSIGKLSNCAVGKNKSKIARGLTYKGIVNMSRRLNILLFIIQTLMLSQFPAYAAPTSAIAATDAKLTEAHGDVYKRSFIDWTKEALTDPSPASVGELLHEGMQIGTGQKSWAQLQWQHMSARAWANSVYAIAPNQRLVYLVSGEMLYQLDKHRADKSPYFVWTNLLQARIRGTTVLFQATKNVSRITVLEGTVEVLNKIDHSVVTITPGVVYEISSKTGSTTENTSGLTNLSLSSSQPTPIFETSKTSSSVTAVDPMVVMNHPLLREFESPLSSLPLITDAMSNIQSRLENVGKNLTTTVTDLLRDSLTITMAPRKLNYSVGAELRNIAQIAPGTFDFFQPEGVVGASGTGIATSLFAPSAPNVNFMPANIVPTNLVSNLQSVPTAGAAAGAAAASLSGISALSARTATGAFNTVSSTAHGILPGSTLTNTVGGTVNGVANTLNNTVNNTLNGLGGLLGH
jgi:hypothetical protein